MNPARKLLETVELRFHTASVLRRVADRMAVATSDPSNLATRACPVCGSAEVAGPMLQAPVYEFRVCRRCSLIYAPRVLKPEVERRLYSEWPLAGPGSYWELMHADSQAMRGRDVFAGLVRRLLQAVPGTDAAIDVGCGFGKLTSELAPRFREVVGLELNERTAEAGRALFGAAIRSERLEHLDRPDASVDLIVMNAILEHVHEMQPMLAAAQRLLKPHGILWVVIPHGASLGVAVRGQGHRWLATHLHVNMFNTRALERLLVGAGLVVREIGTNDNLDLSALDWLAEKGSPVAKLFARSALLLDWSVAATARTLEWPSRLRLGSHLAALAAKPAPPA